MKLICESYGCYCDLQNFNINGIDASWEDFGTKEDIAPDEAPEYGCGDMEFTPKLPTQAILDKYKINVDEYKEICNKLEQKLSFGYCGWCV